MVAVAKLKMEFKKAYVSLVIPLYNPLTAGGVPCILCHDDNSVATIVSSFVENFKDMHKRAFVYFVCDKHFLPSIEDTQIKEAFMTDSI